MSTPPAVRKAVFPVAGLGTRFLPATKASPKEMLPVVDKPLIQYAVEEAYAAGIRQMIFVTGRNKRAIEDHFDSASELEDALHAAGKNDLLELLHSISPADMHCLFVRQPRACGLGHAVLCAEPLVGSEPFAVLLADDLMRAPVGCAGVLAQMLAEHQKRGGCLLAVQDVPPQHTRRYGIVAGQALTDAVLRVEHMVEKPAPAQAPSRLGVAGRYVLVPEIFARIRAQEPGSGGEIQLTDAIADLAVGGAVYALRYQGKRYDCGSKEGFLQATVELALQHPQVGVEFRAYLKSLGKL